MEIKKIEAEGHVIYVFECPRCGRKITSLYKNQLKYNAKQHMLKCREQQH